jgi:hypothetical protein
MYCQEVPYSKPKGYDILQDIGRTVDIVRDTEFKSANAMLSAKLKFNLRNGLSRPTQHHPTISNQELMQINTYLSKKDDIVALRFGVWYLLAIHFVSRGIEFHHQLNMNSIKFQHDEQHVQILMYFCGILGLGFQAF